MTHLPRASNRLHSLDILRAVAIIQIFISHYDTVIHHNPFGPMLAFRHIGVEIAFVLSGYLIADSIFRAMQKGTFSLRDFYARRCFRIMPCYLLVLFLYFAFPILQEKPVTPHLWQYLTFTMNFGLQQSGFSQIWFLCVEQHFYLVFPLVVMVLVGTCKGRVWPFAIITFVVLSIALRWYLYTHNVLTQPTDALRAMHYNEFIFYPTYARLDGILLGILAAWVRNFRVELWAGVTGMRHSHFLLAAGACLIVAGKILDSSNGLEIAEATLGYTLKPLGVLLILLAALNAGNILSRVTIPGVAFIAQISFCIFLVHKMTAHTSLMVLSGHFGMDKTGLLFTFLTVVFSVFCAWILHLVVERPFINLRNKSVTSPSHQGS